MSEILTSDKSYILDKKWSATEIPILLGIMLFCYELESSPLGSNKKHNT